ncbi:MAG: LysR substrate-binding domain-containing protein [Sulfitobacter sp.]
MQRDLEIDLLRSFVAVSQHRNFTHAAHSVGRTQSAVSLQIKRLEEITGKRLFERSKRIVSITPSGEALLVYANRILTANDAALSHMSRPQAHGLVRIGTPDDYATYLLPPILAGISQDHPRLQFEVTCDNAVELLPQQKNGTLDIVIATHRSNAVSGQVARYEPLHWVAAPSFIDDPVAPISVALFPTGCVCRAIALDALEQIDRPWQIAYSTRSIGLMERALLEGGCVSVMEASIIPPSLTIIDGQPGFPALPEVAISVHQPHRAAPHVALVAEAMLAKLGRVTT